LASHNNTNPFSVAFDGEDETAQQATSTSSSPTIDSQPSSATFNLQGKSGSFTLIGRGSDFHRTYAWELPQDQYETFMQIQQRFIELQQSSLRDQYTTPGGPPDLSNYPGKQPYATVTVGGQVVATILNDGVVGIDNNDIYEKVKGILDNPSNIGGPDGAQARADQISKLLGGRVSKSPTAITQSQYDALPPIVIPEPTIDYEGMKNDPMYAQIQKMTENYSRLLQDRSAYLAKQEAGVNISV